MEMGPRLKSGRTIVLASSSPRRSELLSNVFEEFVIDPPIKPEEPPKEGADPRETVVALARSKAEEVATRHEDALVIGCDTCVVTDRIIGKPQDQEDAKRILQELSGREHLVLSGLWVIDTREGRSLQDVESTKVFFKELFDQDLKLLLESGEYEGKAGAYAIQGLSGLFISKIEGDYNNVMGLPMSALFALLREFGI